MVYGKVPPQAKDLEEAVLGAIMLEKSAFDTVMEILKPECFYVDAHQRIYKAMQGLAQKSQPIDILTVVEELRSQGRTGNGRRSLLCDQTHQFRGFFCQYRSACRIILQKFIQRELIRISGEIIGDAYEDQPMYLTCWMMRKANCSRSPIITFERITIPSIQYW